MSIGKRLKAIRQEKGWRQFQLADFLNIKVERVRNLEINRIKNLSIAEVKKLAALGFAEDWIVYGKGDIHQQYIGSSSCSMDLEIALTAIHALEEWLSENNLFLEPEMKVSLIKKIVVFYNGQKDKATKDSIKTLAIPFALNLVE